MRLVQVAKALGMTGQELRHELMQVNFGVKPTDREVPDTLAKGILRFIANKKGITVDMVALGFEGEPGEGEQKAPVKESTDEVSAASAPSGAAMQADAKAPESLNVLRKLSLEGVSQQEIARQQQTLPKKPTKAERDERLHEEKLLQKQQRQSAESSHQQQIKKKEGVVRLPDTISVKELAEKTGIQVPQLVATLMRNGIRATITQSIDFDTAAIIASELGVTVQREERSAKAEDLHTRNLEELLKDDPENLVTRPPIVVVMGHVDHGKTAILDAIRQTNVVSQEAGGITQHIGAYQVEHTPKGEHEAKKITFLDTPGHQAFTAMRARGAQITDIVILVVSAEEGVKETTLEALDHAKEAGVPIIVAINKMDKERADPERVKGELAGHGLQPEEWGGTTPFIPCSAVTKMGINDILDHILLIAELQEYKANPKRAAVATVIESHLDTSMGPLATVIVNAGTLKVGDICVCGETTGKVKAMIDASGKRLQAVGPSAAARMSGLDGVPVVGDILQVVPSEKEARALLESISEHARSLQKRSFSDLVSRLSEGKMKQLKVVLKTDAQGSLEAIQHALSKVQSENINVKVIHGAIGAVSENDVMMASASDGIILAFSVPVSTDIARAAEREGVKVRQYSIVYELLDEVEALLKGLVEPVEEEKILGHLEVRGVFLRKKSEQIIGGKVTDGIIKRVTFRLQRDGQEIGTGRIVSLKHVDKDIKEAKEGQECGMKIDCSVEVQEKDVLEVYHRELRKKEGA
jgi:translation initiation factor IF-2